MDAIYERVPFECVPEQPVPERLLCGAALI